MAKFAARPGVYDVYYQPPDGAYWIGEAWLEVAGCQHRLDSVAAAFSVDLGQVRLSFMPEPNNRYDRNAIKILADGIHIGYVAREDQEVVRFALGQCTVPLIRRVKIMSNGTPYIHYAFCATIPPKKPKKPATIKIECPHCGQHYEIRPPSKESIGDCSKCGGKFTISPWEPPPPPPLSPPIIPVVHVAPPYIRESFNWVFWIVLAVVLISLFGSCRAFLTAGK